MTPADPAGALAHLAGVADRARDYVAAAKAPNTLRAYRADWADFAGWCERHRVDALPAAPETVALYLTALAGHRKAATLQRRLSAISQAHQAAGLEPPTKTSAVRAVWAGIRRTHGTAQMGKTPVVVDELRRMVDALPGSPWASGTGHSAARLRGRLPPLRARRPRRRRRTADRRWPGRDPPQVENGPGGSGPRGRHPLRLDAGDLSGPGGADLADGPRRRRVGPLLRVRPPRPADPRPAQRPRRRPGRAADRRGGGPRGGELRRPQPAGRAGHQRGRGRRARARDRPADRAQVDDRPTALHPDQGRCSGRTRRRGLDSSPCVRRDLCPAQRPLGDLVDGRLGGRALCTAPLGYRLAPAA